MNKKLQILDENGIIVLEVKERMKMIIVKKADLERASKLVNDEEYTVASRW